MALSPIQLFQSNENSLAQILAGGNQTVSGIMDKAIQIGRDISNKQLSQEKDLIQMRQQQTAFDQRRAETAQQDYEDTRRFARGVFETDRNYGLQERQEERANVRDLFNMQTEQERIGLAREGLGLSKARFGYEKSEDERKRAEAETERKRLSGVFAPAESAAEPTVPATLEGKVKAVGSGIFGDVKSLLTTGKVDPNGPARTTAPAPVADTNRVEDLFSVLDSPEATPSQKMRAKEELERLQPETAKPETPSGRRAARSLEIREETLTRQKAEDEAKVLVGDTKAFMPQVPQVYKEGATKKDLEEAESYDKDRFISEVNSAQNYSEEAYVNFSGMTLAPAQKEKRRKLWRYADSLKGSSTTPSTGGSSPVRDLGL